MLPESSLRDERLRFVLSNRGILDAAWDGRVQSYVVKNFVVFLKDEEDPDAQYEAARALEKITSAAPENIRTVVDAGAISSLMLLLSRENEPKRQLKVEEPHTAEQNTEVGSNGSDSIEEKQQSEPGAVKKRLTGSLSGVAALSLSSQAPKDAEFVAKTVAAKPGSGTKTAKRFVRTSFGFVPHSRPAFLTMNNNAEGGGGSGESSFSPRTQNINFASFFSPVDASQDGGASLFGTTGAAADEDNGATSSALVEEERAVVVIDGADGSRKAEDGAQAAGGCCEKQETTDPSSKRSRDIFESGEEVPEAQVGGSSSAARLEEKSASSAPQKIEAHGAKSTERTGESSAAASFQEFGAAASGLANVKTSAAACADLQAGLHEESCSPSVGARGLAPSFENVKKEEERSAPSPFGLFIGSTTRSAEANAGLSDFFSPSSQQTTRSTEGAHGCGQNPFAETPLLAEKAASASAAAQKEQSESAKAKSPAAFSIGKLSLSPFSGSGDNGDASCASSGGASSSSCNPARAKSPAGEVGGGMVQFGLYGPRESTACAHVSATLANIAAESTAFRNFVVNSGAFSVVLAVLDRLEQHQQHQHEQQRAHARAVVKETARLLSTLCEGGGGVSGGGGGGGGAAEHEWSVFGECFPTIVRLMRSEDEEVCEYASRALRGLCGEHSSKLNALVHADLLPLLCELLCDPRSKIKTKLCALAMIANIVKADDTQTQAVLDGGVLKSVRDCFKMTAITTTATAATVECAIEMEKEASRLMRFLMGGSRNNIQAVLDADELVSCMLELCDVSANPGSDDAVTDVDADNHDAGDGDDGLRERRKRVLSALCLCMPGNLGKAGSDQVGALVSQHNILPRLCAALDVPSNEVEDLRFQTLLLTSVEDILELGRGGSDHAKLVEQYGGAAKIKLLSNQFMPYSMYAFFDRASMILRKFFTSNEHSSTSTSHSVSSALASLTQHHLNVSS